MMPGATGRSVGDILKYWGLWIAVLPGAFLAAVVVSFPIHFVIVNSLGAGAVDPVVRLGDEDARLVEGLLQAFFAPVAIILVGSSIAPAFKIHTAIVLTVLYCFTIGMVVIYVATNDEAFNGNYEGLHGWLQLGLTVGLAAAGAITGASISIREERARLLNMRTLERWRREAKENASEPQ